MDVTPTILNMLNSSSDFDYYMGKDLLGVTENYILYADLAITDGSNFLFLDERYVGDVSQLAILEAALEERISASELQKKLLISDYFKNK